MSDAALEQAARDELAACIRLLYDKLRAASVADEHPHYVSGLRDAALELRKRAHERGVPTVIDDDVTTPVTEP